MITCDDCGYQWPYRGSSWRTHCRECRKRCYIPVSIRPDVEVQYEHGRAATIAWSATIALPPGPMTALPLEAIQERVPSRPSRPRDPGSASPVWQRIGDVIACLAADRRRRRRHYRFENGLDAGGPQPTSDHGPTRTRVHHAGPSNDFPCPRSCALCPRGQVWLPGSRMADTRAAGRCRVPPTRSLGGPIDGGCRHQAGDEIKAGEAGRTHVGQ